MIPPEHDGAYEGTERSPEDQVNERRRRELSLPPLPRLSHVSPRRASSETDDTDLIAAQDDADSEAYPPFLQERLPQAQPIDEALPTLKSAPSNPVIEELAEHYEKAEYIRASHVHAVDGVRLTRVETETDEAEAEEPLVQYDADPITAFLIVVAISSIGLSPLEHSLRYVIAWILMGGLGAVGYLLGRSKRFTDTSLDDLLSGVLLGLLVGVSLFIPFGSLLATVSERMFDVANVPDSLMHSWTLMAVVFVMPTAESLFFRGAMQEVRSLIVTSLLATLWWIILFFPHLEIGEAYSVGLSISILFTILNFFYSYLRFRNSLAAAWLGQIVTGFMIWFVPRLIF